MINDSIQETLTKQFPFLITCLFSGRSIVVQLTRRCFGILDFFSSWWEIFFLVPSLLNSRIGIIKAFAQQCCHAGVAGCLLGSWPSRVRASGVSSHTPGLLWKPNRREQLGDSYLWLSPHISLPRKVKPHWCETEMFHCHQASSWVCFSLTRSWGQGGIWS